MFIELDIGIEVTVYLPRFHKFQIDEITGAIIDRNQKIIYKIGDQKTVKIIKIKSEE